MRTSGMKQVVQSILKVFGYQVIRIGRGVSTKHSEGLDPFFSLLKRLGFAPGHIVDVGANRGIWTREAIKYFPAARYTLVEPQDHLKVNVQDLVEAGYKIHWVNAGASDEPGSLAFNMASRDDSSSFVAAELGSPANGGKRIAVRVTTLNEIAASSDVPPGLVKIDAEGFDLKVLAGASDLFGKTDIFLVEAMVSASGYENTVAAVIQRMSQAGYRVIDITDFNRSPKHGIVWLCELAFLRNGSPLLDSVTSYE